MKKPTSFFKFVSFERKDILENGQVRFAPIGEFNDPFELEPVITPISREYIEFFIGLSEEEQQKIEFSEEDSRYSSEREWQVDEYEKIYKDKIKKYGVLSLSSNADINPFLTVCVPEKKDPRTNILMWSHYANSHKGFIIEFDSDFISGIEIEKVEYSNYRDFLTFEDIDDYDFHKVFYKKSEEWKYEQEYRAVLPLSEASEVKNDKYHLFRFNKKNVKSITFGCAMVEDNKQEIIDLIENDKEFGSVLFNHALLNNDDFCLQFYNTAGEWTSHPSPFGFKMMSLIPQQKKI